MAMQDRVERIEALMGSLFEREEYYKSFLQASPWGILVVDTDYRIVYMNTSMEELCGYDLQDIEGEHLHLLIPPEDREVHEEHEKDFASNPRVRLGDHPFKPNIWNSNGERVPVEISLAPVKVGGEIYYYSSIRPRGTLPVEE